MFTQQYDSIHQPNSDVMDIASAPKTSKFFLNFQTFSHTWFEFVFNFNKK